MTTSKIELPKLPDSQVKEIQAMHANGWSLRAIALKTDVPYTTVYFFAVGKGRPVPVQETCWCGAKHYGNSLCKRHWLQARQQRRAA